MKHEVVNGLEVAKEMVWLAWQACGGPLGMGWLQNRPGASKQEVWAATMSSRHGFIDLEHSTLEVVKADYVFGRRMKLYFWYTNIEVGYDDYREQASPDYNAWAGTYKTLGDLLAAAKTAIPQS